MIVIVLGHSKCGVKYSCNINHVTSKKAIDLVHVVNSEQIELNIVTQIELTNNIYETSHGLKHFINGECVCKVLHISVVY